MAFIRGLVIVLDVPFIHHIMTIKTTGEIRNTRGIVRRGVAVCRFTRLHLLLLLLPLGA